jgi:hypothetical protein
VNENLLGVQLEVTAQSGPRVRNESYSGQQADSANHADGNTVRDICRWFEGHVNF